MEFVRSYDSISFGLPSLSGRVGSCVNVFEACSAFASRYGLHACQVAFATFYTRGFSSLVASTAALIATGWSEPVPGWVYPRCGPAPFTAHPIIPVYQDRSMLGAEKTHEKYKVFLAEAEHKQRPGLRSRE
jgi:hypothetical protein